MEAYSNLVIAERTGDLRHDIKQFLIQNGHEETAEHCIKVGEEAERIAKRFGEEQEAALYAGYLHDISTVYPNGIRIQVARSLGIDVLPEEELFPMIMHQKISRQMAKDLFYVEDVQILDAVGCHTTLRKNATRLDNVLFVADKIAWDQQGTPPYIEDIVPALDKSLEHGSFAYINYLWIQKEKLKVVHPWLADAYNELKPLVGEA
ncbi:HD domain-containing protein [Paenibacillaceae bacterium]|nr:HD domain-containing protein [Paenibacillaceae bacterium]